MPGNSLSIVVEAKGRDPQLVSATAGAEFDKVRRAADAALRILASVNLHGYSPYPDQVLPQEEVVAAQPVAEVKPAPAPRVDTPKASAVELAEAAVLAAYAAAEQNGRPPITGV